MKDDFLASLLAATPERQPGSKLVDEIRNGESGTAEEWNVSKSPAPDEPSMMELMIAAQREAKADKLSKEKENTKALTTTIGSGFKKGFFGQGSSKKLPTTKAKIIPDVVIKKDGSLLETPMASAAAFSDANTINSVKELPTVAKPISVKVRGTSGATDSISADVQIAMTDGEPQILKQLKQGGKLKRIYNVVCLYLHESSACIECALMNLSYSYLAATTEWITPALLAVFQENEVIKNGLGNQKCTQALQLMLSDPKEAKKRFEGDSEVELFMSEFGKVMSSHFDQLGATQENQKQKLESKTPQSILECERPIGTSTMGVLHAEAVVRER